MTPYEITTDRGRLDLGAVHAFLASSYWSPGIPRATFERAAANSLCFGVLADDRTIGFARVITDRATFGYLADVYILEAHRGKGLARRLMAEIRAHPDLQGLRRMLLVTRDAHDLYRKYGFGPLGTPERMMECHDPDVYRREPGTRADGQQQT